MNRHVVILQFNNLNGFKWLLVTLCVTVIIGSSQTSVIRQAKENRQLLFGVFVGQPIAIVGKSLASMRARPKLCSGKRLDSIATFDPDLYITSSHCTELGGNCCNLSPAWGYASNDPAYMKPFDGCHGCYNTNVTVRCSGNLLRNRNVTDPDDDTDLNRVTAKTCVQSGGQCCDPRLILQFLFGDTFGAFDPRQSPDEESCSNCYSGPLAGLECTGKLLQSESHTANICSQFNGQCCQGIYGPFNPTHYPDRDCSSCYSDNLLGE